MRKKFNINFKMYENKQFFQIIFLFFFNYFKVILAKNKNVKTSGLQD